jgi:phasin family protein
MNAVPKAAQVVELVEKSQAQIQDGFRTTAKQAQEFLALGQGNIEAVVKSGQIWAAGLQDIAKQVAVTVQTSLEETTATIKALSSVKSPQEAVELQTKLATSALEKVLADSTRISEASLKLFQDALAPLTERATLAAEKVTKAG